MSYNCHFRKAPALAVCVTSRSLCEELACQGYLTREAARHKKAALCQKIEEEPLQRELPS